jgi:WD40 repeat protein
VLDSYRAENALSFSSDDRWLAAGHDGAQPGDTSPIRIWDLTSGRIHLSLGVALEDVAELKFSPDSKWLLSINDKRGGRLWDTSTGQQRDSFKAAQSISHAEFSPDGVFVATAGPGCFELWNLESNRVQATLRGSITTFAFSPDRELLATGTANGDVQLWHVKYMNGEFEVPRSTE